MTVLRSSIPTNLRRAAVKISAVIPTFDEAESLRQLHGELSAVADEHGYELEIVFIDDGSTDGTWEVIRRLAAEDARVRGLRLRCNFGKAAALSAGFARVRSPIVFTLDADLQDDPHEMPRLLAVLEAERLDVVSGWKQVRHDPWHKVWPSRVFNRMVGALTGVRLHDHNSGFKCYRRAVVDEIRIYGELHRFIPVLARARGFRVGETAVHHRPRRFGHSKYGVLRFFKGFLDLLTVTFLTRFGRRPQHLFGTLAAVGFVLCYFHPASAVLLLLLSLGLLGELIVAERHAATDDYAAAERTDEAERREPAETAPGRSDESCDV